MEGSALANPTRRQASGADTALSNAVTSVTVSQQESEGQASEPAAGSTGEPQSPRAARSQVSTAVSFEGARAAGSAVQPERSVDEDSALSAAEPDGPIRSNRPQQGPRPANSLISTAVHPTIRHTNNGGNLTLLSQQNHAAQQQQTQTHQQIQQQQQQLLQQQQRYALPAVPSRAPYGRGAGLTVDHYASSPEVQRPHSITSQAVETRAEGHGHAGRSAAEQGEAPGRGFRTHPTRSNARGATPASVYGQIQAPRGAPGPPSPRKDRQHSLQRPNAVGGGGSGAGGMDPATAAAAAAAAFLGNGLVGGWGLMQGLGQGSPSITAAGHSQPALPHALLAAAAAGASGALPLPGSPFNLATLGQLQLQAASHMQQHAAAAAAAGGGPGLNGAPGTGLLWQPSEQADCVPGGLVLPSPTQGALMQAAAPVAPTQAAHEKREPLLLPPHQHQLLQSQMPLEAVAALGGGGSNNLQDTGDGGRGGSAGADRSGTATMGAGNHGQQPAVSPSQDFGASRHRLRQVRPSYGVPAAALLESMYGGGQPGVSPFALADMHGLQGLLMSASMSAAAAAAAAAGGIGGPADDGTVMGAPPGAVRVKPEQHQQHTRGSSQVGLGAQHLLAQPRGATVNANIMQVQHQQQQQSHHVQQPAGNLHQQQDALLFPGRGYGHGSQHGEGPGTGAAAAAVVTAASSEAGRSESGAVDAVAVAALQAMAAAEPVATATATSACGGGHGTVVGGGCGVAVASPGPGAAAPHPAMQLYVPVMLPFDLVSAHMAINQAAAAAAAVAGAANQTVSLADVGGVIPAVAGSGGNGDKLIGGAATDGRGVGGGGGAGTRDPQIVGVDAAATTVHSTQALNTMPQRFLEFEHESAQQNLPGVSSGRCSDGGGDADGAPCAATSVARGVGASGGYGPGCGEMAIPAANGHAPRGGAGDGRGVMAGGGAGASTAATPLGNGASPALSQHSAGSNPGAGDAGAVVVSPEPGALGRGALAAPAVSVETVTASVAAPLGPAGASLASLDAAQVDHPGAAAAGGGGGLPTAAAAAPGAGVAGFGGLGMGGNPSQHNHNNNVAINAHSNAYGAGPSMTQTADYRSHLQVALSLLLQATSAAYNSQRQSGIAGANEGSGIFAAAAQQASASNAIGQEVSEDMGGSGAGVGGADGGVVSGNAGGAGVLSSGAAGGAGGTGSAGAGNGMVCLRDTGGGGAMAAAAAAYSMHVAAMGPVAVAVAEPMDTEGQVVDQAAAASRGLHASPGVVAAADLREVVAGTTPGLPDDGGGDGGGGVVIGSPQAYQAPQWSTQRGGGAIGGGGARSAVHGSSGGAGAGGSHGHPAAHHGQAAHHHHNHHHALGTLQSPVGYHHHHRVGGSNGSGKTSARTEGGCSLAVAQLEGALLLGCGKVAGITPAGASVGSAGGAAAGDGEQADNNSALQMDAEAGHPAASVHATVIAEESDGSEGGGGDDSGSMEVPPTAGGRSLDGGGGAATGTGGGIAAGVGSSKAAAGGGLGEIVSQRFEGSRSRSREGQASKQPHDQLMQGPPTAGPGLGGFPDPRDSSMGMAAGPSHDGTDSGSNGATTSDTVDMAEDSRMGSASEHADSGMGGDPQDMMQMDENLLPLDEHGAENVGAIGIGGVEDVEERGDDNDNAGSADGGDGGGENVDVMDGDLDGDGDAGARMSVGPAAALLGMLGGGGGGASTGHMGPAAPSDGKGSPADKAASHHPDRADHLRHHQHPATHHHHHQHLQTLSKDATGCGGGGVDVRTSTSGTARISHHHHHCGAAAAVAAAVLFGVSAAAAAALVDGCDATDGDDLVAATGPAASGAAGSGGGGGPFATAGAGAMTAELHDRGSPAPQVPQLQAANSTAMGYMRHQLHGSPRRLGGEVSCELRAVGAHPHPYGHQLRDDRRPAAGAAAIAGVGPAFSASNADRQNPGVRSGSIGAAAANRQGSDMKIDGGTAGPATAVGVLGGGGPLAAMDVVEMAEADMKSSSQEAAGSVQHRQSHSAGPTGQHMNPHHHHHHHRQLQLQLGSQDRPSQQQQVVQRPQSGGESAAPGSVDGDMSAPPPVHIHQHMHHCQPPPPSQLHQQLIGHLHGVQGFRPALSHSQEMPPHQTQPGGHHLFEQEAVNANENTTLAALGGGAALHPASVLTTASQPLPLPLPLIPDGLQLYNDGAGGTAAVGSGAGQTTGQTMTHGSAGRGDGRLANRFSQDALPQVTVIHGAFPGMAATAAEALALHQQAERQWLASAAAAEAQTAAAVAAATADAQASWQGDEDRQPSGSPGGPSLSAVMPQFTEVHGAFTRTAGTAAEAQASGLLLRCGASRGAAECDGVDTFAGGTASGGNHGPPDPPVGELRRQSTSQARARLTAPRDAEVVGVSGTPATAGVGARADGSASPQAGHEGDTGGDAAPTFHRSRQQQQHAGDVGMSCGLGQQQQLHQQQAMTHRTVGTAAAAGGSGGGGGYGADAGPGGLPGMTGGNNYTKAESALHRTPASRAPSRGGGVGLDAWTLRSGRVRGGHDGAAAGPPGVTHTDGGETRDAAPGSVDGHGSNGIAPLEPYGDDDGIAMAAVSQSGEVMLLPVVGGDFAVAAGEAVGVDGDQVAAAELQGSSRRCDGFGQLHGVGPALSGAASRGGTTADGCGATGFGAVTPDTRRLPRHGLASGRGMPTWAQYEASPPQHQQLQLQSQQQVQLQALPVAGVCSGGRSGHQGQHAHTVDGQLSTQAAAYGGVFDDEYESDGERRRAEGPPQPQMTILVTSHAANSHHTVSGGTAVVSEADNGVAGVGPGGGGSPAVAAWEEEFDGPHRPPGAEAAQQQGSWRGGGGMGGGQAKSAVMSSSRVEPHAYPQHSTPQGHQRYHHNYRQHSQQTPHAFPTQSAVFGEQAPPGPSLAPQQDPRRQQQQLITHLCAASQRGPQRQRRGGGGGDDDATADAAGTAGETQGEPVEVDDGDAVGPVGGSRAGRGASRGRRGVRNRTRGEKRKRTHEGADREQDRRCEDKGSGGGDLGVDADAEKRRTGIGTKPSSGV
ncbi:hypothetical protein VaNZ11_016180 [Volvox africanus]|uniref:Protein kinase domain-containing protein n=1 Tax=Volvox africanus TaxID=51714 RepID=A0ABQ5SNX8_9CHLO|nr:hypothetical protein VaNZ11_016180 [Volvox africanus]